MNAEKWAHTYAAVMGVEVVLGHRHFPTDLYIVEGCNYSTCATTRDTAWITNDRREVPPLDANAIEILLVKMQADGWSYQAFLTDSGDHSWRVEDDERQFFARAPHAHEAAAEAIAQAMGVGEGVTA